MDEPHLQVCRIQFTLSSPTKSSDRSFHSFTQPRSAFLPQLGPRTVRSYCSGGQGYRRGEPCRNETDWEHPNRVERFPREGTELSRMNVGTGVTSCSLPDPFSLALLPEPADYQAGTLQNGTHSSAICGSESRLSHYTVYTCMRRGSLAVLASLQCLSPIIYSENNWESARWPAPLLNNAILTARWKGHRHLPLTDLMDNDTDDHNDFACKIRMRLKAREIELPHKPGFGRSPSALPGFGVRQPCSRGKPSDGGGDHLDGFTAGSQHMNTWRRIGGSQGKDH
jgi:hypothetical protein